MNAVESEMVNIVSDFTEEIQKTISGEVWEELNGLLSKRQQALEEFFSHSDIVEEKAMVIEIIKKIQKDDAVFIDSVQAQKREMEKQYTSLRQGRKLVKVYQEL